MNFITTTFARFLYGLPFVVFGVLHFTKADQMQGIVPSFFPFRVFWVYLTGVALIAAGVSIITRIQARLASLLLAFMLLIFIVLIHIPGLMGSLAQLLKDAGLLAGALLIAGRVERH